MEPEPRKKARRGFAAMSPETQKAIASKGGKTAHAKGTAHEFTSEEAKAAGRKGGLIASANRARMQEIGRKGGHAVAVDREHMREIGSRGAEVRAERLNQRQMELPLDQGKSEEAHHGE